MEYVLIAFILLIGPLALWAGADSRPGVDDHRSWWPGGTKPDAGP
jgi:hypothetical protein